LGKSEVRSPNAGSNGKGHEGSRMHVPQPIVFRPLERGRTGSAGSHYRKAASLPRLALRNIADNASVKTFVALT
jgi:hypothetical protein